MNVTFSNSALPHQPAVLRVPFRLAPLQLKRVPGPLLLVSAHGEEGVALVVVKPVYAAAEPSEELGAAFKVHWLGSFQALPQ